MGVLSDVKSKASDVIETTKLNSKISSEQNEINAVMKQIGEFYYNKYLESKTSDEGIAGFCKTIDGHNAAIAEAKAEIERIKAKSAAPAAAPAAAASGGTVCPACGAKFEDGKKFCTECGAQTVVPAPAPAPAEADGVVCSACGKKNPAGQKFCNECGGKLDSEKRICACGAEVAPGKKFCGECGAKFN